MVLLTIVALAAASCGDDGRAGVATEVKPRSGQSSPFRVSEIPQGYDLVVAGQGTAVPDWGVDEFGTHEPFTVLGRGGSTEPEDLVVVSTTGFEGYQGGLGQASRGYLEGPEELSLDGRTALFSPAAGGGRADLVAVAGDDVAVRVTAPDASREELVEVLERVEVPADRTLASAVVDPPGELEVVGSLDADAVLALTPGVEPRTERVPGPTTAHAAGWVDDGGGTLSVLTLPAGAADLAALSGIAAFPRHAQTTVRAVAIGGRPAVVLEQTEDQGWTMRAVWMQSDWGDTVVVTAMGQRGVPAAEQLQAVATSVQRSERSAWDAFVVEAAGGPGVHPDRGSVEITRGTAGGIDWLLQTGVPEGGLVGGGSDLTWAADPCLKLSDRRRACATSSAGGVGDWVAYTETGDDGMPPFALITTSMHAAQVRASTSTGEATAPLVPVPGTSMLAAVVVVSDPGIPVCPSSAPLPEPPLRGMRVNALDAEGAVVGCLGMDLSPAG